MCPYTWKRSFIRTHAALHYWLLPDQATGRWAATPPCQVSCIRHYHFDLLAAMAAQVHQLVACCHRFLWSWCGGQVLTTCQHTECNVNTPHAHMCRQAQISAAVDRSLALRRECHLLRCAADSIFTPGKLAGTLDAYICRGCERKHKLLSNLNKHAQEIARMQSLQYQDLTMCVEAALTIMRLSCEQYFTLISVFAAYLFFRQRPPLIARRVIWLNHRVSTIFKKASSRHAFAWPHASLCHDCMNVGCKVDHMAQLWS